MTAGSHNGGPQLASVALQDFGTYAKQATAAGATVAVAVALGLAVATDAYAVAGLVGSAAAALALGVLFAYRRFGTLIATWLFFLFQPLLAAAVGEGSAAGHLVNVVDIPILLIVGLLGLFLAARDHAAAVRWLLIAGGAVLACGFASDLAAGAPLRPSIIGAMLRMKLFLLLGAGLAVQWTPALARRALKVIIALAVFAGVAGILDFASGGALRGIFAGHPAKPPRLGYVAAGGIFQNVAVLNTFMVIAFTVLMGIAWQGKAARRVPQLLLVGLAALSTLRLKAIVSIPAAAAALAVTSRRARSRLLLAAALGALTLGGLIVLTHRDLATEVVNEQVGRYTSETSQPRQRLETASIEIARNDFPLGAGFGRFGSAPSIEDGAYSPVYSQYGLSKYYGFRPSDPVSFALDTSWPGLLGEVGVLGFLAFGATILVLTVMLFRRSRQDNARSSFASIGFAVMVVILIDSLARPTLFDSFTLLTVVLIVVPGLWLAPERTRGVAASRLRNDGGRGDREAVDIRRGGVGRRRVGAAWRSS
jgi:hypothetical protein